jgi:asparagine synthase (glutamine-hydrolysing)
VKKAVEDLLPREIVYRPKMGFPTPLKQWLRDPRAAGIYAALTARDGLLASCCDRRRIEELVERQKSGRYDATDRIWRLLNLQIWGDVFLTGKGEARWEGLAGAAATA